MDWKFLVANIVGLSLVIFPEPATTATGTAILIAANGINAISKN